MNRMTDIPPKFAIVDNNVLACIGLADLLEMILPNISIRTFLSVEELQKADPTSFVHMFVSAQIYIQHANFFKEQRPRPIVLTNGDNMPQLTNAHTLNVCQSELGIIKDIMAMRQNRHQAKPDSQEPTKTILSTREMEVLVLIVKGHINKEIADVLGISLTTVISHRKNIMDKLGIHTVSGLTVYALLNGYVQIGDL